MDVDLIFKIAAIGILVAVLNQLLIRSGREEQAMMTTLAGLIVVLTMLITQISTTSAHSPAKITASARCASVSKARFSPLISVEMEK